MKKFIFLSLLFSVCGLCGLQAQTVEPANPVEADTAIAASADTVAFSIERENNVFREKLPEKIGELLQQHRFKDALAEYAKYREGLKDEYQALYSDKMVYETMKIIEPGNASYKASYYEAIKKLRAAYPKKVEVILMEFEELGSNATDKDRVRIYTNVLAADSTYMDAYMDRGLLLMGMNETKKACRDFSKLPKFKELPWYEECADLLGLPKEKPAETEE